jgi:hypothetical protein
MTKPTTLTLKNLWSAGFALTKSTSKNALLIAIFILLLPQFLVDLVFDFKSVGVITNLQTMTSNPETNALNFIDQAMAYYGPYLVCGLIVWFLALAGYFALVNLAVSSVRTSELDLRSALTGGLRYLFPQGLALSLLLIFLAVISQALTAVGFMLAILALMAPVIIVTEGKGAFSATWEAITLKYVRDGAYSSWAVMFALISVGALFYAGLIATALAGDFFLRADELMGVASNFWESESIFSAPYILSLGFRHIISITLVTLVPGITTALYFTVVTSRPVSQA